MDSKRPGKSTLFSSSVILAGFLLAILSSDYTQVDASTLQSDVSVLQDLRKAWNLKLNWKGKDPCGSNWQGVFCDDTTNSKITRLMLNNLRLNGSLPLSIGNLVNLQSLDLSFNSKLQGSIPATLGALANLVRLNLQSCGFTGSIPQKLSNLKNLEFIALNGNRLSGEIPSGIGFLNSLEWCDLSNNKLSGELPMSSSNGVGLDNLTAVNQLHLNNNFLSGSIPGKISTLPKLIYLMLDGNNFSGPIPTEIGNLSQLKILRLDKNHLEGSIPSTISNLTSLNELHLSNNRFNSSLPDLSKLQNLKLLRAGNNNAPPSMFPSWITNLTKLETLELQRSNLVGPVPPETFALPNLEALWLDENHLNGSLNFNNASTSLAILSMEQNNITATGPLPKQLKLSLAGNPVCKGNSSNTFCSYMNIQQVWQPNSKPCAKTCDSLKTLLPTTCSCAFPFIFTLQFLSPAFSAITSERIQNVTEEFAMTFNITGEQIWIGSSEFTAEHRLVMNVLIFPPQKDGYLKYGLVSSILSQLSTQMVNVAEFGPFILTSTNQPETEPVIAAGRAKHVLVVIIGICFGVSAIIASLCSIAFCILRRKKRDSISSTKHVRQFQTYCANSIVSEIAPRIKGCRWFSSDELKMASNGFLTSNLLGVGGYGKVYKGKLQTGELVAIKRAEKESLQGLPEFNNEIELLSRLHHKNLVNLVGFCTDDDEQMLVYEYMPNRTLRDHLQEHSEVLDWKTRLSVALGAAKGLEYLHELADPPIIHRDVKSTNILLDENFVAKVADLGLSKLAPTDKNGKQYTITQVKGTLGYLDPEYYVYQQLSEKSDVYSFGVVLVEIITGRQPIEKGRFIVRELKDAFSRGGFPALYSFIDPFLRDYTDHEMDNCFELALHCLEDSGKDRPRMHEVTKRLNETISPGYGNSSAHKHKKLGSYSSIKSMQRVDSYKGSISVEAALSDPNFAKFDFWTSGEGPDKPDFSFQASEEGFGVSALYSSSQNKTM